MHAACGGSEPWTCASGSAASVGRRRPAAAAAHFGRTLVLKTQPTSPLSSPSHQPSSRRCVMVIVSPLRNLSDGGSCVQSTHATTSSVPSAAAGVRSRSAASRRLSRVRSHVFCTTTGTTNVRPLARPRFSVCVVYARRPAPARAPRCRSCRSRASQPSPRHLPTEPRCAASTQLTRRPTAAACSWQWRERALPPPDRRPPAPA